MTEESRLAVLRGYGVLDTPNEPEFDDIVREAARLMRAPMALISLIDQHRQWFKASFGIEVSETPRSISFCTHAIRSDGVFVIPDASRDERFAYNPFVAGDPKIRFYAGAPLKSPGGMRIGTLCVIDLTPREEPGAYEKATFAALADRTIAAFEARKQRMTRAA